MAETDPTSQNPIDPEIQSVIDEINELRKKAEKIHERLVALNKKVETFEALSRKPKN